MAIQLHIPILVVSVAILIATVTDIKCFKIYNSLTYPLLILGFVYHGFVNGFVGVVFSLLGGMFGAGVLLILFLLGGIGGGDVKLLAAIGAWLGLPVTFLLFCVAAMSAGIYAVVLTVVHKRYVQIWMSLRLLGRRAMLVGRHLGADEPVEEVVQREDRRKHLIPFGAMLGVGLLVLLLIAQLRLHQ